MAKQTTKKMLEIDKNRTHEFLAEGLLMPNLNRTNGNRSQMFTSHISQCIQMNGNEVPLIHTGFENQVGTYSTGIKKAERDFEVVFIFNKNKYVKYYLIRYIDNDEYDLLIREEANNLSEKFGNKFNNEFIDNLKNGDKVSKGEVLYKDQNYDEDNNFMYGTNINSAFIPFKGFTNEDGIAISESLAKKMSTNFVHVLNITVNTNDIPLNLYGDNETYKSFPDIGEDIKNGTLFATRRLDYGKIVSHFTSDKLRKYNESDSTYKLDGKIIDIDILNNESIEKLRSQKYSEQFVKYIDELERFYKTFVTVVDDIVRTKKFSNDLIRTYNKFKRYIDPNVRLLHENNQFDKIIFRVKVMENKASDIGSKLSTRYG